MATGGHIEPSEGLGSDFVYDFVCTRCDSKEREYVEASHYCPHCREFYCRPCRQYACDHDLLGRDDVGLAGKRQNTGHCQNHPGNKLESFCGDHAVVCCRVCVCLKHRACTNLEYTSRAAKRVGQNEELEMLQKEFFSLQKRVYTLRSKIKTNPKADKELLRNIKDYRAAINTLLDEFEQDSLDELKELRQKCVDKIQSTDVQNCSQLKMHLDDFQRNLVRFRIDEAMKYEKVKQFTKIELKINDDE